MLTDWLEEGVARVLASGDTVAACTSNILCRLIQLVESDDGPCMAQLGDASTFIIAVISDAAVARISRRHRTRPLSSFAGELLQLIKGEFKVINPDSGNVVLFIDDFDLAGGLVDLKDTHSRQFVMQTRKVRQLLIDYVNHQKSVDKKTISDDTCNLLQLDTLCSQYTLNQDDSASEDELKASDCILPEKVRKGLEERRRGASMEKVALIYEDDFSADDAEDILNLQSEESDIDVVNEYNNVEIADTQHLQSDGRAQNIDDDDELAAELDKIAEEESKEAYNTLVKQSERVNPFSKANDASTFDSPHQTQVRFVLNQTMHGHNEVIKESSQTVEPQEIKENITSEPDIKEPSQMIDEPKADENASQIIADDGLVEIVDSKAAEAHSHDENSELVVNHQIACASDATPTPNTPATPKTPGGTKKPNKRVKRMSGGGIDYSKWF